MTMAPYRQGHELRGRAGITVRVEAGEWTGPPARRSGTGSNHRPHGGPYRFENGGPGTAMTDGHGGDKLAPNGFP